MIKDLRRVAWSVVVALGKGRRWPGYGARCGRACRRPPQAAECAGYAAALQFLGGPSLGHGDCMNVVRDARRELQDQLCSKRM